MNHYTLFPLHPPLMNLDLRRSALSLSLVCFVFSARATLDARVFCIGSKMRGKVRGQMKKCP